MQVYDRDISLSLIKHDGRGNQQAILDVSNNIMTLGDKSWAVGGTDLVRINPSTLSFRLFDQDDSIYNWIVNSINQTDGLIPPFVMLTVDGVINFYGTVTLDNVKRSNSAKQDFLDFSCQDWSRLLADTDISQQLKRPLPMKVSGTTLRTSKSKTGDSPTKSALVIFYLLGHPEVMNAVYFDNDSDWLIQGDHVYCTETTTTYVVERITDGIGYNGLPAKIALLTGFLWPNPNGSILNPDSSYYTYHFTRMASNAAPTAFLTVTKTVTPDTSNNAAKYYTVEVDSVNGVYPGDKLDYRTAKGVTSYVVRDIDSEKNKLIFVEPITEEILIGGKLQLADESMEYVLFEPFKKLINTATATIGGAAEFTRFAPHTFTRPFLSWLPFRGPAGDLISAPNNLQPGLTNIVLKGPDGQVWSGTPDAGYTAGAIWATSADWTQQLSSAPSSLMPKPDVTDYILRDNRPRGNYRDWKIGSDPKENEYPPTYYIFDYQAMKRYEVTLNTSTYATTIYSDTWNGTAWTNRTTAASFSGTSQLPLSGVAFSDIPGSLLFVLRNGTIVVRLGTYNGTTLALPDSLKNGALVRTRFGTYIIGQSGAYGRITWSGSALVLNYYVPTIRMADDKVLRSFNFFETTLTALDANNLYILGSISYVKDSTAEVPEVLEEVWLFNLDPNATGEPPRQPEKIADGSYSIARAIKDPSGNRIVGILGGRLFQISSTVTDTFERFKPDSSALDLIEHLCIAQNAIALPGDGPMLQILSRNVTETASTIQLDIKQDTITRTQNFFSAFEVKGGGEDISWYWVAPGSNDSVHELSSIKRGGKTFNLDCGDYVSTISQCASLGADYADFYGKPRMGRELDVIYSGTGAAPYESLKPLQRIKINSETSEWHVLGVQHSISNGTAKIKLIQAM